jgi:hypothetical protein
MAQCQVRFQENLPPVCLCCDADASHYSRQTFISTNPWTLWTVPLGTWYYNKVVMQIPLCDAHRNTIRYRWVFPFLFLVLGGLGIFVTYAIYSSINGREASDAVSGWIGGAVAITFVIFYAVLLYVSFTRPHVAKVQGDYVTLRRVSQRFAAAVRSEAAPVIFAEIAGSPPQSKFRAKPIASSTWIWLGLGGAGLAAVLMCCAGLGLVISANLAYAVRITATTDAEGPLLNGARRLRIEYRTIGELDDGINYLWVIRHGQQKSPPRLISASELRRGGFVEFYLFDLNSPTVEIWLESNSLEGTPPKRISNIARIRTE